MYKSSVFLEKLSVIFLAAILVIGLAAFASADTPVIYFCDAYNLPGSIYELKNGIESTYFTRPYGQIYNLAVSPDGALYYSHSYNNNLYKLENGVETIAYTHIAYLKDIAFDNLGRLYFSDAMGFGYDGHIYRLEGGVPNLYYTVRSSDIYSWAGDFTLDQAGNLFLSSGNTSFENKIYKVDGGVPVIVYQAPGGESIKGISCDGLGNIYYASWNGGKIYKVNLSSGQREIFYYNPLRVWLSDVFIPILPLRLSLKIEDALEGVPVNKLVGDTNGPADYTYVDIVARLISFSSAAKNNIPVVLTIPGDLFGSPVGTWVRNSPGGVQTPVPFDNLGAGQYRITANLSQISIFPIFYKQFVWRFLIPNNVLPQDIIVNAVVQIPCTDPFGEGTIRILAPGSVRSLIMVNRKLLYDNHNSSDVTMLLQRLHSEAQGFPASHTPRAVIYHIERYDAMAASWDYTTVNYSNEATANVTANAIDDLIEDWHEDGTKYININIPPFGPISIPVAWPKYLLIVGDDDIIPFYRYDDPSNDEGYWSINSSTNPSIHATDEGYLFTDNPYADLGGGTSWQTGDIELWVGRLLGESASDMINMLQEGVSWANGQRGGVVLASVDGWELGLEPDTGIPGEVADLHDVTALFRNKGFSVRNDDIPATEVRTIDILSPEGGAANWNMAFTNAANDPGGMDIFFIGGHNGYDLASIYGDDFSPDDTPFKYTRFNDDHPIVMIVGCHGGLPVPDIDVPGGVDHCMVYDTIHEGGRAYIGASGFSYGSPGSLHGCLWGERLIQRFFDYMLKPPGSNSMVIGKALAEAKRDYTFGYGSEDWLDRKTVTEFNLFGIPWSFIFYPNIRRKGLEDASEPSEYAAFNVLPGLVAASQEGTYSKTFEINIDSYEVKTESQNGASYDVFSIIGGEMAVASDSPILPYIKGFNLPLPFNAEILSIDIIETGSQYIGKYNIPVADVKPFSKGGLSYTTTTDIDYLFPKNTDLVQYQNTTEGILFTVYPIQHNPVTNDTSFYNFFKIRINYQAPLAITITEFGTDKDQYVPGETINTKAKIENVGSEDVVLNAILTVLDKFGNEVGVKRSQDFTVASDSSYTLPLSLTAGLYDGDYTLQIELLSNESVMAGASASISVLIHEILSLTVPSILSIGEEGIFEVAFANYGPDDIEAQACFSIQDKDAILSEDLTPKVIRVPAGATETATFAWIATDQGINEYNAVATVAVGSQIYGPASKTFIVQISGTPPVADAGPDKVYYVDQNCVAYISLDGSGSHTPDNNPLTYEWTWPGGSATGLNPVIVLPVGKTTISLTVNNGKAKDTDMVIITVIDNLPPSIVCPPDITIQSEGSEGIPISLDDPVVSDNCDEDPEIVNDAPEIFPVGETIVTWTATDISGNDSTCTQKVTVKHPTPSITFNMDLPKGWSMISLPLTPSTPNSSDLFPGALVIYGYKKGTGYERIPAGKNLETGKGYWILLMEAKRYTLVGQPVYHYSLPIIEDGWDMIGGCTTLAQVSTHKCNIGVIYKHEEGAGYQRVLKSEGLIPGKGYWILLNNVTDDAQLMVNALNQGLYQ
ncbi:MAG: C25 family cysteine peptidase [bacterium]